MAIKQVTREESEQEIREMALLVQRVFRSEAGKQLMSLLEMRFSPGDLVGSSVEGTYFNLGSREVIEYLKQYMTIRPT